MRKQEVGVTEVYTIKSAQAGTTQEYTFEDAISTMERAVGAWSNKVGCAFRLKDTNYASRYRYYIWEPVAGASVIGGDALYKAENAIAFTITWIEQEGLNK